MSNNPQGVIHSASEGGISGTHPSVEPSEFLVAPSTSSEFNTARLRLIPIACWKVEDIRFAFDSSLVTSDITKELRELVALRETHKKTDLVKRTVQYPPFSVFGHADPVGADDYNKALSGRRATVIYALLIHNAEAGKAVSLWSSVARHEQWGANQQQTMQSATGLPAGTPDAQLFQAYMQSVVPKELTLSSKDFLGHGADAGGKGDYQGCSRFNPLLVFSQQKEDEFKQADRGQDRASLTKRNDANAPNRRVMVLLFRPGSKVDPAKWPCPRATESVSGCVKRFFSDGQRRRTSRLPDKDRKYDELKNTFACRFYDRLLSSSPCERSLSQVRIRLFDRDAQPLSGAPCLVTVAGRGPKADRASGTAGEPSPLIPPVSTPSPANATKGDDGQGGYITILNQDFPSVANVKWSRPKAGDGPRSPLPNPTDHFDFELDVVINIPEDDADKAAITRLNNLGYVQGPVAPEDDIRAFQIEYKARFADIVIDGTLNAPTKNAIKTVHEACDPVLKGPRNTPV